MANRYWVSWYATGENGSWELHQPWWISGERDDGALAVCAAVIAINEQQAKESIAAAHDKANVDDIEWRFCNERAADWSPFCDRFPRAEWMQWPAAAPGQEGESDG